MKTVIADPFHMIESIGKVRSSAAKLIVVIPADPKDKAAVRDFSGMKNRTVGRAGRDQKVITKLQGIDLIIYLIGNITFQKEIEFVVIMLVKGNLGQIHVIVIEDFKQPPAYTGGY